MKRLIILIILFSFNETHSQKLTSYKSSLSDLIKKNFNYDTLRNFSCKETPAGIYIIRFKVNKQYRVYDYKFSDDSLFLLRKLFEAALNLSLNESHPLAFDKDYLLQVYYNNYSSCIYQHDTTLNKSISIDKEVSEFLSEQLIAIENSINRIFIDEKSQFIVLNPVVINNVNPNHPVRKKGLQNDYKKGDIRELSDDKMEMIIEQIRKKRNSSSGSE